MAGTQRLAAGAVPRQFIFDVDGVFTTGQFVYTADGKIAKVFGAHDGDGIKLVKRFIAVCAISADHRGFPITKKRIQDDMGIPLFLVNEHERLAWLRQRFSLHECIYMGDGIFDARVFAHVGYSIAPANAFPVARERACFVTDADAGSGAVAEACLHVLARFFKPFTLEDSSP